MIVKRLRIRSHGAPFSIDHSYGIRNDVEDRLELCDAAREILSQIFSFGNVDAGEKQPAPRARRRASTRPFGERREGDLDETPPGPCLKGNSGRDYGHTIERIVDLIGEIRERVRERVIDRP